MTIVLLILKILGIVLLVALGLIALALFVPVRYRMRGSYRTKPAVTLRVSWLFHLFVFGFDMAHERNDIYIRICGFKKILTEADNTEEFEDTIEETADAGVRAAAEETAEAAEEFVQVSVEKKEEEKEEKSEAEAAGESIPEKESGDGSETSEDSPKKKRKKNRIPLSERIDVFFGRIRDILLRIQAVRERIKKILEREGVREVPGFLLNKALLLLRKLCPKKFSLTMTYSTGSPDTTGQLLGVLACFPYAYRQGFNITPDFTADSFYVDAVFDLRGRVFLYQVLMTALSVLLDKNCRTLYNEIRHGS